MDYCRRIRRPFRMESSDALCMKTKAQFCAVSQRMIGDAEQSSEIENKIASLRTERRRRLSQSQDDEMLDELKTLNQIIDEYQPKAGFDKTLFEIIVKRIEVIDSTAIKFLLFGDIELTEEISKKARCAQREQKNDPIRL